MPDKGKKRAKYDVCPDDFVVAWQNSDSADEVAAKLSMSKTNVLSRACNYRSCGVNLKVMKRNDSRKLDTEHLNSLAGTGLNHTSCREESIA